MCVELWAAGQYVNSGTAAMPVLQQHKQPPPSYSMQVIGKAAELIVSLPKVALEDIVLRTGTYFIINRQTHSHFSTLGGNLNW